uniref:Uncharacterized protein n=1 Tax=Lepeophtheirus salmonis TaxID=72036 RepID=A0A0K2SZV0_LEPSM
MTHTITYVFNIITLNLLKPK